jgi:hypothetical protein
MDKVQKTNFTDYNALSSELFRLHKIKTSLISVELLLQTLLDMALAYIQQATKKNNSMRNLWRNNFCKNKFLFSIIYIYIGNKWTYTLIR